MGHWSGATPPISPDCCNQIESPYFDYRERKRGRERGREGEREGEMEEGGRETRRKEWQGKIA